MSDNIYFPIGPDDLHLSQYHFKPENLTLARKLRGLTKSELAERIHKTPGAISQFESGKSKPEPPTLKAMAFALGFPVNFFARELTNSSIEIDNCHFRSLRAASQKDRNRVLASGALLKNFVDFIEEHVLLPEEKITSVLETVKNDDDIEKLAVKVRNEWGYGIGPIPDLFQLLEGQGVIVSYLPEDCLEVDDFSTWQASRPYIFLVPTKGSSSKTRFSCSHELGHLVMHADAKPGSQLLEDQANRFAGAFLFPRDAFIREYPRTLDWDHLYELKKRWRMSVAAIVKRAYDLDCISERTYRRAFIHLNETNQRKNEPYEPPEEKPSLMEESLRLIHQDFTLAQISETLCIRNSELEELLHALGANVNIA